MSKKRFTQKGAVQIAAYLVRNEKDAANKTPDELSSILNEMYVFNTKATALKISEIAEYAGVVIKSDEKQYESSRIRELEFKIAKMAEDYSKLLKILEKQNVQ